MQLLIILDAIKRSSPSRVTAVIPYYGYARQDRKHGPREPISAKLVADLISVAGPDRVLFLDLHAMQIQGFFDMPADDLKADSLITDYFTEKGLTSKNATIVAVNNGGARRVRRVALLTGSKIALIETRQQGDSKVFNVVGSLEENCIMYVVLILLRIGKLPTLDLNALIFCRAYPNILHIILFYCGISPFQSD